MPLSVTEVISSNLQVFLQWTLLSHVTEQPEEGAGRCLVIFNAVEVYLVQMHKKAQQTHSNQMNKNNLPEEEESAALKLGLEDKVPVLK